MEQMSERDIRALKRHQASLELERKELLEKLERQKARIRSLENKGEDAKQKEATANVSHGPLQAVQGATGKPVISREEEVRQATEPRSLESWREDLDRWLKDSKSSVKDGATVESPILLRSPGSVKSLPVFSDDEDLVRKEPIEKGWTLQKGDLSSRIDVLRKTITSSVKKPEIRGVSVEKPEKRIAKDPKQIVKATFGYNEEHLSFKPYLQKDRDKKDIDSSKGKILIQRPVAQAASTVEIDRNRKGLEPNPRFAHESGKQQNTDGHSRIVEMPEDIYEGEVSSTDEDRVIEVLQRLKEEDRVIEEENRRAAEEEAQRRERILLLQRKATEKERERQQTERLVLLNEEGRKLEQSLQRKVQERIATDQRLKALIDEELRLTDFLSSHGNNDYSLSTERDLQQRESSHTEEKVRFSYPEREITETELLLNRRAEELNRKEAYLKRLEYEIRSKGETARENIEYKDMEIPIELKRVTSQGTGTEPAKGEVTHFLKPYINFFSGADPLPKNESAFEEWKLEVEKLRRGKRYPDMSIDHAIRSSLKGQARKVFINMDPECTTQEVIEKMESVFGNVASGESVLQEFYTASQRKDESVAEWGIRLEDIFQRAVAKGYATAIQKDKMLRERFWRSLHSSELKNATRLHFLSEDSFETLRRKVRAEETEMSTDKTATGKQIGKDIEFKISPTVIEKTIKDFAPKPQHQPVTQDPNKKAIDDLAKRLQSLEKTIQTLVNVMPQSQGKDQQGNLPPKSGKQDRNTPKQPSLNP